MPVRYDKLVPALKRLLDEDRIDGIGRSVAFLRRLRQLSASAFVWAVVLSRFGSGRPGFEQARQWYARVTAVLLWPRPFQVRFKSPATVRLFQQTFDEAVAPWRTRPGGKQRPCLTNLTKVWPPKAIAELYRLRWQVERVFKELKQDLNLESIPAKDPYAAQVFVWASLLAPALSRTVSTWVAPLASLVGLSSRVRPAVLTRALRGNVGLLARVLTARTSDAILYLRHLAEELLAEAQQLQPTREDSLQRLTFLRPAAEAAWSRDRRW